GGMSVLLMDSREGAAAGAKDFIEKMLTRSAEKGNITQDEAKSAVDRVEVVNELGAFAPCHVVTEAIVENLAAKRELLAELETIVGDDCILATNTSSLSVTTIAAETNRPERLAGMHFFNPVPLMKLVEIIDGEVTAPWVGEALTAVGKRMGRVPVRVKDAPGFLVNQVGRGFNIEAAHLASEGIAGFADVDRIMREAAGFRMGPFE
ncbi:MAG: 3-hydroxyacyl-CoA dehydrogenase NAD-binding domain-containing protein, partial [Phycisphaerales bacterium]|nr:3-hydroxyacyl-CoA dehydrogenase NAD-binding domain-containing protein [Phycisphaerales bacterium]